MARRTLAFLAILGLSLLASSVAAGGSSKSKSCGGSEFSYAGLQSENKAHGVAAKVIATVDDLDRIAADDDADVPALSGWRRELFGDVRVEVIHQAAQGRFLVPAFAG